MPPISTLIDFREEREREVTKKRSRAKRAIVKTIFVTVLQLVFLVCAMGGAFAARTSNGALDEAVRTRVSKSYWRLPLRFEANKGQTDNRVKFLSRGLGYNLFLTSEEAVFSLRSNKTFREKENSKRDRKTRERKATTVFSIQLMSVNPSMKSRGLERLPIKTNYLIGNDPRAWRQDIPTYAKVEFKELYAGIDLVYYGNQRQLEFDFLVHPGADHKSIRMKFKNVNHLNLDRDGNLILSVAGGKILLEKPLIYQQVDGKKHTVAGQYKLQAKNIVGFQVASHDPKIPLVIDPVLNYSTYLGGDFDDLGNGIAVDTFGNAYTTGSTQSNDFPTQNPLQPSRSSLTDVFISKFNSDGSALIYSTYLGGNSEDIGNSIKSRRAQAMSTLAGTTQSTDFPITPGAFQPGRASLVDGFVAKLNPDPTLPDPNDALIYSTYFGGNADDRVSSIAVDGAGNAYLTGLTQSNNFPTTAGAFQVGPASFQDAFVVKLNPDPTLLDPNDALIYSTYLGGIADDAGNDIAVDGAGNAYLSGLTQSNNFPTTAGAFQVGPASFQDAFVVKFDPDPTLPDPNDALIYSTYLGGDDDDFGNSIAVDSSNKAYVVGTTQSTDFPTTAGAFQPGSGSFQDAFVAKFDPDPTLPDPNDALIYSTYFGGNNNDFGNGIAVDSSDNAYVTGATLSTNFPLQDPIQASSASLEDAFVAKFDPDPTLPDPNDALIYSTYLGGDARDFGNSIAVDTSGNAYITGSTGSNDFPTEDAFQPNRGSLRDAFVAKINPSGEAILYSTYIGGTANELGGSIAVDSAGNVYVVGTTESTNFPTQGPLQGSNAGQKDVLCEQAESLRGHLPLFHLPWWQSRRCWQRYSSG